jgi:hypothetical protein
VTTHIDLGTVLRQTLSANLYSNLVTRPTGAAVRTQIELQLRDTDPSLTIIDFSHVSMIDFSCADEVIAKLLLRLSGEREAYFVFRGLTEDHWDSVEAVLERHGLALVVERDSGVELVGVVADAERRVFQAIKRRGRAECWQLARDLGEAEDRVRGAMESMWRRRLIMRVGETYMPVGELQ